MENVLEARNIHASLDDFEIKDINIDVPKGKVILLGGKNGAGKTAVLETLLCSIKPNEGSISIKNKEIFNGNINHRKRRASLKNVGVLFQDDELFEQLTVRETLDTFLSLYPKVSKIDLINDCPFIKDELDKEIRDLSKGGKQLIKILLSLSHGPDIVIMDEPSSNLDEETVTWFIDKLKLIKNLDVSFFVALNELWDIGKISDELYVVEEGRIDQHYEDFNSYCEGSVIITDGKIPEKTIRRHLNILDINNKGNKQVIFTGDSQSEIFRKLSDVDMNIKSIRGPKLNDFYRS